MRMWFASCCVLVAAALLAGSATAQSHRSHAMMVRLPDGTRVAIPTAHPSLRELGRLGIVPGQHGLQAVTTTVQSTPRVMPQTPPPSAIKCDLAVCEEVDGVALQVTGWDSWTTEPYDTCTYAVFWEPKNTIFALGQEICANGYFYASVNSPPLPEGFANQSQACASWALISGKPCATIHT